MAGRGNDPEQKDRIIELAPTVGLLHELVTKALCNEVFSDLRDKERQRVWSLYSLARFWTAVVIKAPPSLSLVLEQAGIGGDPLLPKIKCARGSSFDRFATLNPCFFDGLYHRLTAELDKMVPQCFAHPLAHLKKRFPGVDIIDGSVLDKVTHRLKILHKVGEAVLPGCITALYDLFRGYASTLRFFKDAAMSEFTRGLLVTEALVEGTLLLGDRLYCSTKFFAHLKDRGCYGLFRWNKTVKYRKIRKISHQVISGIILEDYEVEVGAGPTLQQLRMIQVRKQRKTYRALTSVLDPRRLSAKDVFLLYPLRWTVERLFLTLKVVLNMGEFYTGNPNGVGMQVYAAAMVHAAFRVAQGRIAESLGILPEEISTDKLFPRLALTAWALALEGAIHEAYREANPHVRLRRPKLDPPLFTRTTLASIIVEHRDDHRRKRRFCDSRARWKSFAHIPGCSKLLT